MKKSSWDSWKWSGNTIDGSCHLNFFLPFVLNKYFIFYIPLMPVVFFLRYSPNLGLKKLGKRKKNLHSMCGVGGPG